MGILGAPSIGQYTCAIQLTGSLTPHPQPASIAARSHAAAQNERLPANE